MDIKLGKQKYGNSVLNYNDVKEYEEHEKNKLENPGHVDELLWDKAKRASQEAFGEIRYPFVMYLYEKWGGK